MNTFKSIIAGSMTVFGLFLYIGLSPELSGIWEIIVGAIGVILSISGLDWKINMAIDARRKARS